MSNENNIANSLATAIAAHCSEFEKSPEFADMVRKHVTSLYEEAIKDTFRWGEFPKAVKKALEGALPANISELVDLPRYNLLMAKELAATWEGNAVSERLVTSMREHVLEFVKSHEVPKYIKASDLWTAYCEQHEEEAASEGWEAPQVVIDNERDGFFYIGFEKEPASESSYRRNRKDKAHECDVYLGFHEQFNREGNDKTPMMHDGHPVYELFSGQLEHGDTLGKRPVQFRSDFERLVGALYYGNSLLVLDADDADEICYPGVY
ncbi:hypothetical protein SOM38_10725 [Pantoea agglomerans]|uniref:hypothetical protein n=1 Tax=Enterobacter agglomerans TaxID=549 RepID=UPI002A69B2B1|nr:hypothetical protein [Pantoea agglomerans]MDY0994584.1 hypothetical protein [Pantoea agglomerans]